VSGVSRQVLSGYPPEIEAAMGAPPTEEQWRAISMPLEPYVIVAGAGSGKTSVMAARIAYLALAWLGRIEAEHAGVPPGSVLALTFTNKATENLAARVRRSLQGLDLPEGEEPEILNYHGFAARILEDHGLLIGVEPGVRVLTNAQRQELAAMALDRTQLDHVEVEWQPTAVDNLLSLAEQAANHRVSPDRIIEFNEERLRALGRHRSDKAYRAALDRIDWARAVRSFQELKREFGVIDFGDQITFALDVLARVPDVAEAYRRRFQTVLLDEYQDTNVAQAALIEAVFGAGFPLTAVGDPDQNIYAWRGASLFNLLRFPEQFPRADGEPARKLPLYTNFRSGRRILLAADRILEPLPARQRPDPDKRLEPWPGNGEGAIELARHADEWTEASWIAGRILLLRESGEPWSGIAVLCRKSRLFVPLQEALTEHGIPAEIIGLAGLLKVPAIVEVLSYARAVADPFASVALARILLGPRYRVGIRDLALVAAWAKQKNLTFVRTEGEDEAVPFLFAEALEHLDEIDGLSEEGSRRLTESRRELAHLRSLASRPVGEFLAEIVRRIGLLAELEANLDSQLATATRRNLAAFLDEVHSFTPVQGELTLRAFLDYVDLVEQAEREDWSPVQPSDADSVKVMTVHQAKGLEFDHVFVPGLATDLLPDLTIQQNPAERGKSLDFELRGDADILPRYDGNLSAFKAALRLQEEFEERRTLYVALTRARRRLFVSGAHWYGEGGKPKTPSPFLLELIAWARETSLAQVDPGPDDPGEQNPLIGYRERFVRDWPGPAMRQQADAVFTQGWRAAAMQSAAAGRVAREVTPALAGVERESYELLAAERARTAHSLKAAETGPAEALNTSFSPSSFSVSGIIDYARCPKLFYWSAIRPLPRFSGPAARIGTEIHRWIERQSSGQVSLLELDDVLDLTAD